MNNTEKGYCRLCALYKPEKQLLHLQTDAVERMVNKLTLLNCQIDFSGRIPKTVCLACVNSLTRAYDFVTAVKQAQVALEEIFPQQTIKKKIENLDCDSEPLAEKFEENITINLESDTSEASVQSPKVQDSQLKDINIEILNVGSINVHKDSEATKLPDTEKQDVKKELSNGNINHPESKLTWKDYSWTCAYCGTQFPDISELNIHSIEYHKTCNAYRCTDCKVKRVKLDSFLRHIRSHRKYLQMSCYKCFNTFPSTHEAFKHGATHVTSDFKCDGCNVCVSSLKELKTHCDLYFKNPRFCNLPMQTQTDGLTCLQCNKKFTSIPILRNHLLIHTDRNRDHTCEVCGKCFYRKLNLDEHMLLHDDKKSFNCSICKKTFKTKRHLERHVGIHDVRKPYSCVQCGKCFRMQGMLNIHSKIHTDLFPYVCSYCNKEFRFRQHLNQHLPQHTGIKPFLCKICERPFTNRSNYYKHMKCRHNITMAKQKHTVEGSSCPIDSDTGQVITPELKNVTNQIKNIP